MKKGPTWWTFYHSDCLYPMIFPFLLCAPRFCKISPSISIPIDQFHDFWDDLIQISVTWIILNSSMFLVLTEYACPWFKFFKFQPILSWQKCLRQLGSWNLLGNSARIVDPTDPLRRWVHPPKNVRGIRRVDFHWNHWAYQTSTSTYFFAGMIQVINWD